MTGTVSVVMTAVCLVLAAKWYFDSSLGPQGPTDWHYPELYLSMALLGVVCAIVIRTAARDWMPLVFCIAILAFATLLTWFDLHYGNEYTAFTVAVFATGVIFSTGPVVYALLLGGSFFLLTLLTGFTVPERVHSPDFVTVGIVVGIAFIGCLLLEKQRREADDMAVRLESLNEQLRETSFRDPLTGLYNRRFLVEFLAGKRALAVRMAIPLSVVLIDLDHFKRVNDSLGHAIGDLVLQKFSHSLLEGIRESDLAARYGGEEFVLILPQATSKDAARVTVRILERMRKDPFPAVPWPVTFSAGVATLEEGEPIETLLERADHRLYEAKKRRNLVVSW
jgi:diguanylate cyclase (GGDEF)-like protein